MKKYFLLLFCCGLYLYIFSQNDSIGGYPFYFSNGEYYLIESDDTLWVNQHVISIKFNDTVSIDGRESFSDYYNLTYLRGQFGRFLDYDISSTSNFIDVCDSIYDDSRVEEINFGFKLELYGFTPDDDDFLDQWYLDQIHVPDAWNITFGNEAVKVAVIDEGLFLDHEDVLGSYNDFDIVYHNPDEDEWTSWDCPNCGDDDDGDQNANPPITNGKNDDWKGWNYCNYFSNPTPHTEENNSVIPEQNFAVHGTAIAGIIAAETNNATDMAGIAGGNYQESISGIKILPLKVFDWRQNPITQEWVREFSSVSLDDAIYYAGDELAANIITFCFRIDGSYNFITGIQNALEDVYDNHNVLIVAAAGNEGYNNFITFPANDPHVIAVGATDKSDNRAYFPNICEDCASNCGVEMELSAPGVDILTLGRSGTESWEGTSMSAPMVSATAALMLSVNPDLSNDDLRDILKITAEKVGNNSYVNGWNCTHGFGRINTYEAVCEALSRLDAITISSNTIWDEPHISLHDINVKEGATLTITSTLYMGPDARLIIEQGGEVDVNGGTITNYKFCGYEDSQWPGIEVWGESDESQYCTPGSSCSQGQLIMDNATIENALIAVDLWQPDNYNSTGGIIRAENTTFRNNALSIHALNYHYFDQQPPFDEKDYNSSFSRCTFIIDDQYSGDETFYKHVDLDQIKGMKFYADTFLLDHMASNVSQWNAGIAAYNAGFYVLPVCSSGTTPCTEYDSCRFSGFNWAIGVWAPAQLTDLPVLIHNAHFDDNSTGVYVNDHDYAVVLENFFEAGYDDPYHGNCDFADGVGIDIQQSIGFVVENNKLRKNDDATTGNYAGIRVKNCRTEYELIYKNDFDGLSYGNFAEGTNRYDERDDKQGVEYQCNCNSHNAMDFMVQFIGTDTAGAMVRGWQGDQSTASGNIFSRYTPSVMHFSNRGFNTINYYYCDPCTDEEPINIFTWKPEYFEKLTSSVNSCPDHYGGGGHIQLTYEERLYKEESFAENLSDYNSVNSLYESLVDGGDTETELSEIESAEPDDMWELRNQLLGHSPHLSQEVLRAMADRTDVFPDDVLLEILSANPDELNRDTLISYLEQKEVPLPEYMIDILRQAVSGITYKTILENEMAQYHAAKMQDVQDILRSILFDTVFNVTDYRNWLDNMDNIVVDRQIISTYLSENDTISAITLLNLLPSLYGLEGEALVDYNDYKSLVEMQISWQAKGKRMNEIDSAEINILESIASDEGSYAGNMARNILTYAGMHNYCDCLPLIDSAFLKNASIPESHIIIGNEILKISAEPNPSHTYVAFNYELLNDFSTGLINISDLNGKVVWQIQVSGKKGQKVWNTSGMKAGIYYYNLLSDRYNKASKIVIY